MICQITPWLTYFYKIAALHTLQNVAGSIWSFICLMSLTVEIVHIRNKTGCRHEQTPVRGMP
jgi:hypothetical protein